MLTSAIQFEQIVLEELMKRRFKRKYKFYFPLDYKYPNMNNIVDGDWEHIKLVSYKNNEVSNNIIGFIEVDINHKLCKSNIKVIIFDEDKNITFMRDIITIIIALAYKLYYVVEFKCNNMDDSTVQLLNNAVQKSVINMKLLGCIPNSILSIDAINAELIFAINSTDIQENHYDKISLIIEKLWNKLIKVYK